MDNVKIGCKDTTKAVRDHARTLRTKGCPFWIPTVDTKKALADHVNTDDKRQEDGVVIRDPIGS